ncbi:ferritin [Paenalkalicoccus suaedae]|uniref:Ferritin n=1 Tax=Paenalkalicoccus suaedae TaxID=2592382 RepID=A0A859FGM1_9BACI|nr:ferritin [Paenalkalicoccus suaedae]QKS72513.1 ferritin [Paenalkalicoccus suaedae]
MISKELVTELNKQMNYEFYSGHAYLAAAAYCSKESLDGFATFFLAQAEEERQHAMKFYTFINDLGQEAVIADIPQPKTDFASVLDAFEQSLAHEKEVTKRIYKLADRALDEREHATMTFLNWFIEEQVEEEASFDAIIQRLKRIETDSNAFYMLENELGKRSTQNP